MTHSVFRISFLAGVLMLASSSRSNENSNGAPTNGAASTQPAPNVPGSVGTPVEVLELKTASKVEKEQPVGNKKNSCAPLEKKATKERTNGSLWADLGLCQKKLGNKAKSKYSSMMAVVHGDEPIRQNAYFNLYSIGEVVDVSAAVNNAQYCVELGDGTFECEGEVVDELVAKNGQSCVELAADKLLECGAKVKVCMSRRRTSGSGNWQNYIDLTIEDSASFEAFEMEDSWHTWPTMDTPEVCGGYRSRGCQLIAVDPCRKRAGVVCWEYARSSCPGEIQDEKNNRGKTKACLEQCQLKKDVNQAECSQACFHSYPENSTVAYEIRW